MIALIFWASVALVGYTYVGYPILVTLIAHLVPTRDDPPAETLEVTLVIAAYNEEAVISQKLEDTLSLDYPAELLQVIVAADGSDDATADIVRGFADRGVELVHRPERRGKMAALERAAHWATGEVLIFSAANNRLGPQAVRQLVIPFGDPTVGAATGRKTVAGEDGLGRSEGAYWRYEAHLRAMEDRLGCTVGVSGEIFAIRRDLFAPAPEGTINDDAWMALAVTNDGWRVAYRPEAVSVESVSSHLGDELERRTRMVAGQYQMLQRGRLPWRRPLVLWMLVSHKVLRPLVPFGMIGAAAATIVSLVTPGESWWSLATPWNWAALAAQATFYTLAVIGPDTGGGLARLAYLPRFLVGANTAAVRGLWRHLRGGQSATWRSASRSEPIT